MRRKLGLLAAGVALAAGGAGASSVLAGDADEGPGQASGAVASLRVEAKPVERASAAAGLDMRAGYAKPSRKPDVELRYLETKPLTVDPGATGVVVRGCSRKAPVTNGYFFRENIFDGFGLTEQGSSPAALKRWAFYLNNESGLPIEGVTFGIICLEGG